MANPAHLKDLPVEHRCVNEPPPLEGQAEILNLAHLLIRDTSDRIVFWNTGAEDLYGWTRGEALGHVSHDLLQTQFAEPLASIRAQLWRDSQWKGELLHRRRDGEQIAVASHWVLHRNEQGLPRAILEVNNDIPSLNTHSFAGHYGFMCDITDRKREEQLRESRERLRAFAIHLDSAIESERVRISREIHDGLGQALTTLAIDLAWLNSRVRNTAREETARSVGQKIASMSELVDSLIGDIRRIASDLRPPLLDKIGLFAAIETHARQFQERTGIRCHTTLQDEIDVAQERAVTVFRIYEEAMTNVARHAGANRVTIRVSERDDVLTLEVQNDGCAISTVEASNPRSQGILGMQERARVLGGSLGVIGIPGTGTVVRLEAPKNCVLRAETSRQREISSNIRILIVDDHPLIRQGVKQIFMENGLAVAFDEAHDVASMHERIYTKDFDLVLLELSLPGTSGLDCLRELKRIRPNLPILVLSMYSDSEFALPALKAGAAGYLTKERAPKELLSAVKSILKGDRYISSELSKRLALDLVEGTGKLRAARTKIIVISMPDSQERRSRFTDRARNATVAWSFFSAYSVLHPALTYTEQEAIVAKGRPLRKGELGCYSSHYGAWESLQADDAAQYIVLEDDVIVDWAFIDKIVGIDFAAVGIDYLRLYYKRPVEQVLLRQNFVDHSRSIVELSDYPFGTQGYLITKAGAKTLLSHCRIVRRPVDDEMDRSWAHGVPNLAIVPCPIIEESERSTISEMRFERFVIPRHLMLRRFITRVTERLWRKAARVAAKCRRLRTRWRDRVSTSRAQGTTKTTGRISTTKI